MVKKMPEAAKLYFENWDVLDTARAELVAVLDEFWPETWPVLQERLEESGIELPRIWENKASPGKWSLDYGQGKQPRGTKTRKPTSTNIQVWIWDPRTSDNSNCYSVRLGCSTANQQRLEQAYPGAKAAIEELTKGHKLELDWDEAKRICECETLVNPEDLTATWSEVANNVVQLLGVLQAADDVVRNNIQ